MSVSALYFSCALSIPRVRPSPQHRVSKIFLSLLQRCDPIIFRVVTSSQPLELREYIPDPVRSLPSLPDLLQRRLILPEALLRLLESCYAHILSKMMVVNIAHNRKQRKCEYYLFPFRQIYEYLFVKPIYLAGTAFFVIIGYDGACSWATFLPESVAGGHLVALYGSEIGLKCCPGAFLCRSRWHFCRVMLPSYVNLPSMGAILPVFAPLEGTRKRFA